MKISNKRTKNFTKSKRYLSLIENSSVYDVANVSPITNATNLSNKLGHNVFLKREDLQPIFSFKIGAPTTKSLISKRISLNWELLPHLPVIMLKE